MQVLWQCDLASFYSKFLEGTYACFEFADEHDSEIESCFRTTNARSLAFHILFGSNGIWCRISFRLLHRNRQLLCKVLGEQVNIQEVSLFGDRG